MKHPPTEANSRSTSQDSSRLLWNQKFISMFTTVHSGSYPELDKLSPQLIYLWSIQNYPPICV
jgi:hypothetical protein